MSLESLQKKSTKELKVRFNKIRQSLIYLERYTREEDNLEEINLLKTEQSELKQELNKRPHVLSSKQAKLVRQMSKKSGKRLTLKESQLMSNAN